MLYKSTRGSDCNKSFENILFASYSSDKGMFIPMILPFLSVSDLKLWSNHSFPMICAEILQLYTDIDINTLNQMTNIAFQSFNQGNHENPLPLRKYGDLVLLDCSLGPTFAFKDIGQQVIAQLLNYYLKKRNKRANIMVDTSGHISCAYRL